MHRLLRIPGTPCLGILANPRRPTIPNTICSSNRLMFGWAWPFSKRRDSTTATASQSQLQNLLNVAHSVARSEDISRESTDEIAAAMANVPLYELGFDQHSSRGPSVPGSGAQPGRGLPIEYQHIFEDQLVSIGVFKLPAGSTIPLHNHPGMHVWSRILYGRINLRAFDWASGSRSSSRSGKPAAAVLSRDQTVDSEQSPSLLTPSDSNLHQFTAAADTAILDVLIPPYNPRGGRDCAYYEEVPPAADTVGAECNLRCIPEPADFCCVGRAYRGTRVQL
mmetsp:Transcript_1104/g.3353  ORF Transcript_1104/g.3353 Transcript_1104/m.3353 type:complete len:279 (-) Transcript_1104:208-1044(-)